MKNIKSSFILTGFIFPVLAFGQMIFNITSDIQTEFGVYRPYSAEFTPNVQVYSVEPDFSNVSNFSRFGKVFTDADSALLVKNHFTVKRSIYKQLYDVYNSCTWNETPVFVTTDAVLHIYHILFDQILTEVEIKEFVDDLDQLNQALIRQTDSDFAKSSKPLAKEALRRNLAFLCVAQKLLKGTDFSVPQTVSALVDSELVLISKHDGFYYSPIFGNFSKLDYSQFVPRGHYTKSDTLKAYFQSMMWHGWTIFTMEPDLFGDLSRRHTLQAMILTRMVYSLQTTDGSLLDLWKKIYHPTVFFAGKTDDPNLTNYKILAEQIYGSGFLSLPPDSLDDAQQIDAFMVEAQKLPSPKIPNWIYMIIPPTQYKGFRFMGQRFIPDSYMFANLVYPYVLDRFFPKGLDVMAILGSTRASILLDSLYHETAYLNYTKMINEFKTEFISKSAADWAQNLYWNWLYCLMPLLYQKGDGYPPFMKSAAWMDKELLTALASWGELRHDTILYAKQSATPYKSAVPGPPKSYVEPNPHLYARLASLARYTSEGLQAFGLPIERFQGRLELFEKLLLFLRDVSINELENVPLSDPEYENLFCFGTVMQELVSENYKLSDPRKNDSDDMAVVADVHTDHNSNQCLEEGVGYPLEVFVIVNEGGTIRLTRGAIFSYYEFTLPISERLTDEAWRTMLTGKTPPAMPEWTENFMDVKAKLLPYDSVSPASLYYHEFSSIETETGGRVPEAFLMLRNYPNPFNPETRIVFELPERTRVVLRIFNSLGQEIIVLCEKNMGAGRHELLWTGTNRDGHALPSGLYFYRLETGKVVRTGKMVLMR